MYRAYKLKSGRGKKVYVDYRNAVCILYDDNNEIEEQIGFDDSLENPSIVYRGETIHLENFLYRPLEDTIDILEKAREGLCRPIGISDFVNTIIQERERVGFIVEAEIEEIIKPKEVRAIKNDDYLVLGDRAIIYTLVNPVEMIMNHREWNRGIEIEPVDKLVSTMLERVIFDTEQLYCLVVRGLIEVVDKRKYRKENRYDKVIQRGKELEVRW